MTQSATRRATMLLALSLMLVPAPAAADLFLAPYVGVKFGGGTSIFDLELAAGKAKTTIGASAFLLTDDILGYEVSFGYVPQYFKSDKDLPLIKPGSYVVDLMGNLIVSLPPEVTAGGLRPYAIAGVGLIHAESADILNILQVRRTVPAFNAGVGAIGLLTNNVGVRFDLRYLRSLTNDDGTLSHVGRRISYSRGTVGLVLRF
jgi:opacity protein-like surface antigen